MLLYRKKKVVSVLSKRPNFFTTKAFVRAQCKRSPRLWISALLVVPTLWRLSWTLSAAVQHFVPLLHYTDKHLKTKCCCSDILHWTKWVSSASSEKKLEQRIAVTHLKFQASFPTSICIDVINYSSSKYYSTKPTFSVTQQTRQLCGRFRCPLIQHWPFNFDVFCLWFVIGVVVTLNWQLNERPKYYEKSSQKSPEFWFLTEHLIKLHAQQ